MSRQERRSLLLDTWGFDIGQDDEEGGKERLAVELLTKIRTRLREKMCAGEHGLVFRLHSQKMMTLARRSHPHHQELATCHQVQSTPLIICQIITEPLLRSRSCWPSSPASLGVWLGRALRTGPGSVTLTDFMRLGRVLRTSAAPLRMESPRRKESSLMRTIVLEKSGSSGSIISCDLQKKILTQFKLFPSSFL